ncbi:methyltransferase family protein [Devosia sp.]|uniref:methyltransferase family protein n=1 Tax=Devosia sp. TaxID=1871048 RepID=UPI003BAA7CEF
MVQIQGTHLVEILIEGDPAFAVIAEFSKSLMLLIFSLIAVGLTLARRPAKAVAVGLEPRISALLGTYLILLIPLMPSGHIGEFWSLVAVFVMIVGLCSSAYSLSWLGRSYSIMASARKLVTEGPYSVVRHPLYFCEIVLMAGVTLINFSVWSVVVALVVVLLLWRRMINEERILTKAFPEYATYARRVPRIIPRLRFGEKRETDIEPAAS